ncbi:MAG: CinA family protein [Halobacteriales archaeon]|nr:CinA family protein [Halobacteriales archaeon]
MREFAADPPIEKRVGEALDVAGESVATAESCTGGLVASLLTDVPGSSAYFDRGTVTYSYDSKRAQLAVTREDLDAHGAVSEPVARQMARGIRDVADVDWGVSTTGVAGPGGGTDDTPVGTAFIGVAYAAPWGTEASFARVERIQVSGDRLAVKEQFAREALSLLLATLEERETE